jgi:demethylmacrocin O-methyltransferase
MELQDRHDPLTRAAIRHGSDKYGGHLYTPTYHWLFKDLREKPLRLLEIGIGGYGNERAGGRGLRMWAEYFPYADIIGLDLNPKTLPVPARVKLVQGSQIDEAVLARITQEHGPFDIIIDDGSHIVSHMIDTFKFLYPRMAPNGIYAIEDTQTSFLPALGGRPDGKDTIFEFTHRVSLAMHTLEGYADPLADPLYNRLGQMTLSAAIYRNIAVFQRGANTYPSNHGLDAWDGEVAAVFNGIAAEAARNPSPYDTLSRIDMLIWARRINEAERLALETAERHPRNADLLHELVRMMEWAQSDTVRAKLVSMLDG